MNRFCNNNSKYLYSCVIFLISLFYACFLISINIEYMADYISYLTYANYSDVIIKRYNGVSLFFNEPLWLLINIFFKHIFSGNNIIKSYVFLSAFLMAYLILKINRKYFIYSFLILFLWQVMTNYTVHLRQGVAVSLFLYGYYNKNRIIRLILLFLTPFIHSSFFIILILIYFSNKVKRLKLSFDLKYLIQIAMYVLFSILIFTVANILGARQAVQYGSFTHSVSGFGFIFWLVILILFISENRAFKQNNNIQITFILFYLSSYFLLPVAARIFESGLILVLLAATNLSINKRKIYYFIFFIYFLYQFKELYNRILQFMI